jgi:hypothetical protein
MGLLELKNKLLSETAYHIFKVEDLDNPELVKDRISICESRSEFCFDNIERRCKICTCYVDAKARLRTNRKSITDSTVVVTHCPLGKWRLEVGGEETDKEIANHYNKLNNKKTL